MKNFSVQISDWVGAIYELAPVKRQLLSTVLAKMELDNEDADTYSIPVRYLYEENELDIGQITRQLMESTINVSLEKGESYKAQLFDSVLYLEDEELLRLKFSSQ